MTLPVTALILALTLTAPGLQAEPVQARHVTVELVAESAQVAPTRPLWLLLHFQPEQGWHTYWKNPGDSGLVTALEWELPPGWEARAPLYPTPEAIPYGSLMNLGYHHDNSLLVELLPPAQIDAAEVNLSLQARWLVCADACVPGQGTFRLQLPVAASAAPDPAHRARFAAARAALPQPLPGKGQYRVDDDNIHIMLPDTTLPEGTLDVFVAPAQIAEAKAKPVLTRSADGLHIRLTRHSYFTTAPEQIDVVLAQSGQGWAISANLQSP